jgi:serine/threonine protein phosphatase PrpC
MRFFHASAQHIGARRSQEDSFGFSGSDDPAFLGHGGFLAVLCDGMGGMEHGAEASRNAVDAFLQAYRTKERDETIPTALQRSVRETNAEVLDLGRRLGATEGIGTTLIAAVLHKSFLYYVSVGDSGLFHLARGSRGTLRRINRPHVFSTFLEQAVARGILTEQAALEHPERDALTSFIGAEPLDEIDCSADPLRLSAGDTILLASDGLFNTLSSMEIRRAMEGDPRNWPDLLVARTLERKNEYQDNITALTLTLLSQ